MRNSSSEAVSTPLAGHRSPGTKIQDHAFVIECKEGLFHLDLDAVWQYRELLYFFVWRDVKTRYKQTVLGAAWAIMVPFMTMVIFTVIFGNFAKIPSDGLPYPIFVYTALLPWTYFAQALGRSGLSLVTNANLLTKIYFPRLLVPISAATLPVVDFAMSFVVLLGLMAWFGIAPTWAFFTLPLFLLLAVMTALAVSLWLSPLHVKYRDIGHIVPFLTQFWMYASPVIYPVSLIPERWQLLYSLNPMVGVIEGFRWALLGTESPHFTAITISGIIVLVLLLGGLVFFKHMERTFADIV